jgi:hypothetical protein
MNRRRHSGIKSAGGSGESMEKALISYCKFLECEGFVHAERGKVRCRPDRNGQTRYWLDHLRVSSTIIH